MLRPHRRFEPRARAVKRMLRWLEDGGAELDLIRVDTGRQCRARTRRDIAAGEAIFDIPLRHLITVETAKASAIGRAVVATRLEISSQTWLALFLLEERRAAASFWHPYLSVLPRQLPHVPIFFSDRELALLRGTTVLETVQSRRDQLAADYATLCEHVSGIDSFSLHEFSLARAIVASRAFGIEVFGEPTLALVPLADLIDHRPNPGTAWHFDDTGASFVLGATEGMPHGAVVHDTYGAKGNAALFNFYGFCLEDNPADEAVIRIGDRDFTVTADLEASRDMLEEVRKQTIDGDAEAARKLLAASCTRALERYPTTLEEDQRLLTAARLSRNARNAILARMSEKRVLELHARLDGDRIAPLRRFRSAQSA